MQQRCEQGEDALACLQANHSAVVSQLEVCTTELRTAQSDGEKATVEVKRLLAVIEELTADNNVAKRSLHDTRAKLAPLSQEVRHGLEVG